MNCVLTALLLLAIEFAPPARTLAAELNLAFSEYRKLLTRFREGDLQTPVETLARSSRESVAIARRQLLADPWSRADLKAAALLHALVAATKGSEGDLGMRNFHLKTAEEILNEVYKQRAKKTADG